MRNVLLLALAAVLALALLRDSRAGDITVFRCVDAKGAVTLTDKPCPKSAAESTSREMVRPKDAPPRPPAPRREPAPVAADDRGPAPDWEYVPQREPPPPRYVCTSYDGIERESEVYDPNPRCEPLGLYFHGLTPEQAGACRWVEDSCVLLADDEACDRFRAKRKRAASDALHADSSTMHYKRSELRRLTQIVESHCD
jgi:hypothetical protein